MKSITGTSIVLCAVRGISSLQTIATQACAIIGVSPSICLVSSLLFFAVDACAQTQPGTDSAPPISSLVNVKPLLPDTSDYIQNIEAAQQLGKALFWDTQASSGGTACASCHFHAGADVRIRNQLNPGANGTFDNRGSGLGISGPGRTFTAADFPLHRLADPADRESKVIFDSDDVFSSQRAVAGGFVSSQKHAPGIDNCGLDYDPTNNPFHANGLIYRKVEPRLTPSTINAVFYFRQFWDGRANNEFNGVDPFGPRTFIPLFDDPSAPGSKLGNPKAAGAGVLVTSGTSPAGLELKKILIQNASLASQALGPPLSDFEISCGQTTFASLGRKLLPMKPLSTQVTDPADSLFSRTVGLVNPFPLPGLETTYKALIEKAFESKYWSAADKVTLDPATGAIITAPDNGFTQMEHNFPLFWGLAIQAYEQLLISDDSPFDRGPAAMSPEALAGMEIFTGKGKCVTCHYGPLLSAAAPISAPASLRRPIDGMVMGDGYPATYDSGFYNTGVRPTSEDLSAGSTDPYGFTLSFTRQYKWQLLGQNWKAPDHLDPRPCSFVSAPNCDKLLRLDGAGTTPRDAIDGAFKVPTLRNAGLHPPYFHNGGQANLKDVVRFYNRGGDRRGPLGDDTTGLVSLTPFGAKNTSNLAPDIGDGVNSSASNGLGLTETEMDNLVQFLLSLTDQRVACHAGVFDHPELPLVIGQKDASKAGTQFAKDIIATLPATGQRGLSACLPNTGDLFGTLNRSDPRNMQDAMNQVLK